MHDSSLRLQRLLLRSIEPRRDVLRDLRNATVVALCVFWLQCVAPGPSLAAAPPALSSLTLSVTDGGSVSPNLDQHKLRVGATYRITALPRSGFVFSNWSGAASGTDPHLPFVMQDSMGIQANFVPNPFGPGKGRYAGLASGSSGGTFTNTGFMTSSVNDRGGLTARLILAGKAYAFAGRFNAAGVFSNNAARRGLSPLTMQLQLDLAGGEQMAGSVSDGSFMALVTAHRAVFSRTNPAPAGGRRYTLVIAPEETAAQAPGGFGFGTATVDPAGTIRFAGHLGDGTKVSQAAFVSRSGDWPLFASLKSGTASILGWLAFTNQEASDLSGRVSWFQSARPTAKTTYPEGFAMPDGLRAVGGIYSFSSGVALLSMTNGGFVILENGNLQQMIVNPFTLDVRNRVAGPNGLSVRITTGSGLFAGRVLDPLTRHNVAFSGVLLLKHNAGFGCFSGAGQSGLVYLGPTNGVVVPPLPVIKKETAQLSIAGGKMPYYRNRPIDVRDPRVTRAILVIHGSGGNFEAYFDRVFDIVPSSWKEKVMVLAPHFQEESEASGDEFWWDGDWREGGGSGGISSFTVLDKFVEQLRNGNFPNLKWVVICGHSAGGQTTQRFACFTDCDEKPWPNAQCMKFVVANPSSYVYLNQYRNPEGDSTWVIPADDCSSGDGYNEWKYGLTGLYGYTAARGAAWARTHLPARQVELLAGTADTYDNGDMDTDCGAEWQGPFRYQRAHIFKAFMERYYPGNHLKLTDVPGVDHDSTRMFASPQGLKALFFTE